MKDYVEMKIAESFNKVDWHYENYIKFGYESNYFTILGCLYTFLIWIGTFLTIPIGVSIATKLIVAVSGCNRGVEIFLFCVCGIIWIAGVLIDLSCITSYYHKNKKENLPILSTRIILNGLKTLHDFYGIGVFYREFVFIDSSVALNGIKFRYNGTYFGGSWLMTYFLYSIIYYDRFIFKHKLKTDEKAKKKEQNKRNMQTRKDSKERLLKEMLRELKGEEYVEL